jgi:hypothetical protein
MRLGSGALSADFRNVRRCIMRAIARKEATSATDATQLRGAVDRVPVIPAESAPNRLRF